MANESVSSTASVTSTWERRSCAYKSIRLRYIYEGGSDEDESDTDDSSVFDHESSEDEKHGMTLSFTKRSTFPRAKKGSELARNNNGNEPNSLTLENAAAEMGMEDSGSECPTEGNTSVMHAQGHSNVEAHTSKDGDSLSGLKASIAKDSSSSSPTQTGITNATDKPDFPDDSSNEDDDELPSIVGFDISDTHIHIDSPMETENDAQSEYDELNWISNEELPPKAISKNLRRRAVRALKSIVLESEPSDGKSSCLGKTCACIFGSCACELNLPGRLKMKEVMSIDLQKAENLGIKLGKQLLFPSLPKMLSDLWVLFELTANIAQFIIACIFVSFSSHLAYSIAFIVLSAISVILATIDAFVYFYTLGSCRKCMESCANHGHENSSKKQRMKEKIKKGLSEHELIRTILSEMLIYPLLMFDLFEIAGRSVIQFESTESKLSLSLFVIGTFILIVTVYIIRSAILFLTMLQLNKFPVTSLQKHDHVLVITRFMIHVILQMCTQIMCIIAIGVKIRQENRGNETNFFIASPFLWYVVVSGWVIPLLGVIVYFFVKYYWFKDFSAGMLLNLMALLQTQGIAEAVFHGQAKEAAKKRAKKFLKKIDYISTKMKFEARQKQVSILYKFLYPLKIPIFLVFGTLYVLIVIAFCVCLLLTRDENGVYRISAFDGGALSVTLFVAVVFLLIANLHVIVVVILWVLFTAGLIVVLLMGMATFVLLLPFLPIFAYVLYKYRSNIPSLLSFIRISKSTY